MGGGVDTHRSFFWVVVCNALIHFEEIAVPGFDHIETVKLDGVFKIKVNTVTCRSDAEPLVADILGIPRGHIAGDEISETGITLFEVVVPFIFGNIPRLPGLPLAPGYPDAPVVAQRFTHEGELGLMLARGGNTRRMDLTEAGVGESCAFFVGSPGRRHVAPLGVG